MAVSTTGGFGASNDLGLGGSLSQQVTDQTEEQKKRRKLGMTPLAVNSSAAAQLLGLSGLGGPLGAGGR
jgi:hypothetical protein